MSDNFCSLLVVSAPRLEDQWLSVENERLLFSSVPLKTEIVASEEVTANIHSPSQRFF